MPLKNPAPHVVTKEQLDDSPSRRDGISSIEERNRMRGALRLLQAGGRLLSLPEQAILTAAVLLQRFYAKHSFRAYNRPQCIVTACLFLATKVEEAPRRISDILNLMKSLQHPIDRLAIPTPITTLIGDLSIEPGSASGGGEQAAGPLGASGSAEDASRGGEASGVGAREGSGQAGRAGQQPQAHDQQEHPPGGQSGAVLVDAGYYVAKEELLEHEAAVLRAMQFEAYVVHPHAYLLNFCHAAQCPQPVVQLAYGMANDSILESNLCLLYPPHLIAAAALNLAILLLDVAHTMPFNWWTTLGCSMDLLDEVGHEMMDVFSELENERGQLVESRHASAGGERRTGVWSRLDH